jgi:hypothetical protein
MQFLKKDKKERVKTANKGPDQETVFLIEHLGVNNLIRTGLANLLCH